MAIYLSEHQIGFDTPKRTDIKTSEATYQAQIKQTKSNKGLLHAVKMSAMDTFNV